ncbi:formylglycine-generating enzyme family protein [Limnoglobus roseus]|uniref:formylglycine-generating enzyme family protein n=1 Tax=Limnoglobus roseus TaxID=2598579 RepID=UPI00143DE1D4|nr:formylglycine-generating enzyme family protein [Limnoglobus roseus]
MPSKPDPNPKSRLDSLRMTNVWGSMLTDEEEQLAKIVVNDVGIRLALLPAGLYEMGADAEGDPLARPNEAPAHRVVFSATVYMGVSPVTQAEYQRVTGRNPSTFTGDQGGPDNPVEGVSWHDAVNFCTALGRRPAERQAGRTYRLPTEAEWEFACRAGSTTIYSSSNDLPLSQANFCGAYGPDGGPRSPARGRTSPVGAYPANLFGLHDMHGNVWEWCQDWYAEDYYETSPLQNPPGPPEGRFKVTRGGSWRSLAASCRASYRNAVTPNNRDAYTGFRVVMMVAG